MTVNELIKELKKVVDKDKKVYFRVKEFKGYGKYQNILFETGEVIVESKDIIIE